MSDAPTVAWEIDDLTAMSESTERSGGKDMVAEDMLPSSRNQPDTKYVLNKIASVNN